MSFYIHVQLSQSDYLLLLTLRSDLSNQSPDRISDLLLDFGSIVVSDLNWDVRINRMSVRPKTKETRQMLFVWITQWVTKSPSWDANLKINGRVLLVDSSNHKINVIFSPSPYNVGSKYLGRPVPLWWVNCCGFSQVSCPTSPPPHLQNKLAGSPHCGNDFVGKEISYLSFSVKSKRSGCGDTELSYKDANDISAVFLSALLSYFNCHKVIK